MALATAGRMAVGMNLENIVDWSPAWLFTDAFKASRSWISQTFNTQTWGTSWDPAASPLLDLDANGNVRSLKSWTVGGVTLQQVAGTLMFRDLDGAYPGGTYQAEWDGTGVVSFGFDALVVASGRTAAGRNFATLQVTPSAAGIYMRIEETSPTDPVRNFNVWMPDFNGQSFVGQRWQPGASVQPFHPLFLERLAPFGTLRFMGMQETNTSGIQTWADRRDGFDIRQGSGPEGTPSEPLVNGASVEVMVALANALDADPWFNMPHMADDTFVRNFATYVRQNLEPGRKVYVEWANEVWNFGWGFNASRWVADQALAAGLDPDLGQWIIAGQEAKRDMDIWSEVFAGQSSHQLVRVAAGWAAVDWVTNEIATNMGGAFDAIALAPYITPTDAQRASYSASTTVDQVLADTRANIATSLQWVSNHHQLATTWSTTLGRPIQLLAYEGGGHLDGRNAPYQGAFHAASNDPRMGDIYADYLKGLDAAGLDLYMDFQFTGGAAPGPWGDFAKLHRMDEPLATAYRYNAVAAAANGSLWSDAPPAISITPLAATALEGGAGTVRPLTFTVSRSGALTGASSVTWAVSGSGTDPASANDFSGGLLPAGTLTFAPGESTQTLTIYATGDAVVENDEGFTVTLSAPVGATLAGSTAAGLIRNDDTALSISPGSLSRNEGLSGPNPYVFTVSRSGDLTAASSVTWAVSGSGTNAATASDFSGGLLPSGTLTFAPGESTKTLTVNGNGDAVVENDEGFTVSLSAPIGATLAGSTATGLILNDDTALAMQASSTTGGEGWKGSTTLPFVVSRTGNSSTSCSVSWAVSGSGVNPANAADFTGNQLPSGTLLLQPGQMAATIQIAVTGDLLSERNETFTLTLTNPVGATLTRASSGGTILNDDLIGNNAANTLVGTNLAEVLDGGAGQDALTGNGAADIFAFRFGQSSFTAPDRITDFAFGTDRLALLPATGAFLPPPTVFSRAADNSSATSLDQLTSALFADADGLTSGPQALAANAAVLVRATHAAIAGTYILINDSLAARSPSNDLLIALPTFTGTLPALGPIPSISSVFA